METFIIVDRETREIGRYEIYLTPKTAYQGMIQMMKSWQRFHGVSYEEAKKKIREQYTIAILDGQLLETIEYKEKNDA